MNHDEAVRMAGGGFRVTRFEECGNDVIRIVYLRLYRKPLKPEKPKKPRQSSSRKSS